MQQSFKMYYMKQSMGGLGQDSQINQLCSSKAKGKGNHSLILREYEKLPHSVDFIYIYQYLNCCITVQLRANI